MVRSNADEARAEIQSLDGLNTSSTHTIYVRKVEENARGGLVGSGVPGFAAGGAVAPPSRVWPAAGCRAPGNRDTVPRTLDAGAFVLRTAAVRKYGGAALQRLVQGVGRFAGGGLATYGDDGEREKPKKNREAVEALKTIDFGLQGMEAYLGWVQRKYRGDDDLRVRLASEGEPGQAGRGGPAGHRRSSSAARS